MKGRTGATFAFLVVAAVASPALSAELPPIKASDSNPVPQCATPGRLVEFLKTRNSKMNPRYEEIGTDYMRYGEELGVRWDIAFFQMMLETGSLTYTGDVKPKQNNFAGLGATGRRNPGESFESVAMGVRAHLQHVLMYSGEKIEDPVAERTRKVQEWGVLDDWRKTIKGPMTFTQLARQWAPGARNYSRDIRDLADDFYGTICKQPDPHPEYVAEARKGRTNNVAAAAPQAPAQVPPAKTANAATPTTTPQEKPQKAPVAAASMSPAAADVSKRAAELAARLSPPAGGTAAAAAGTAGGAATNDKVGFTLLNSPAEQPAKGAAADATPGLSSAPVAAKDQKAKSAAKAPAAKVETASLAAGAAKEGAAATSKSGPKQACRVWTASYGGTKAVIVKAVKDKLVNYTVLDVNEGAERRETAAYIAAYAKGGELVGEFTSQGQALDKAFELCPEG
jgi:hypothetical protein